MNTPDDTSLRQMVSLDKGLTVERTRLLSEADCRLIHEGSCRLLSETGVRVESDAAVRIFREHGAILYKDRIRIPRAMVERAVQQAANTIALHAKNPDNHITIDVNTPAIYFGTGGQALNVLHYENSEFVRKPATTRDLIEIVRICEQMDNVDFITRPVEPDVSEEEMDLTKTRILREYTSKHMNLANLVQTDNLPDIIETVGDPLLISFIASLTVSPLNLVSPTTDKFLKMVEHDIPVSISSCPQAGTTAPLSEIGELVQVNAEVLSAVVLANLVRSGARVFYRGIPISADLYSDGSPRWCQPESIRRVALIT
ncbi:MAG TPA: trimethylamine methyltransferase family protein, partial [bacterium]|nr:trimethylamine methyltransferase family protein [bacterium]